MRSDTINYHGTWPSLEPGGVGDAAGCFGGRTTPPRGVAALLAEVNGTRVDWPPSSPDLSPLDYSLWRRWEEELGDRGEVKGMARLKAAISRAHGQIPLVDVQAAILKWPSRLKACIKAGGAQFEHGLT